MAYAFDRTDLPEFPRLLHLLMQDVEGRSLSRKEMAARLTDAGFRASDSNLSQWMNKIRTPPPGVPYYASIVLDLDEEQSLNLAWSYTSTYRDKRKGADKPDEDEVERPLKDAELNVVNTKIPDDATISEETENIIAEQRAEIKADIERQRREKADRERESGGASRKPKGGGD